MFRTLLITTVTALLVAGHWTPIHAQRAAAVADNPWKLVTKKTLPLALVAAERFSGGRVLEIRFGVSHGIPGFDAVVAKGGGFSRLRINIPSIVATEIAETEIPPWMAGWVLKADARSLEKAKLHLADAVLKAEEIANAPAVDAGIAKPLTGGNSVLAYDVELIRNNRPERMAIDAITGQRIADPDSFLDAWSPEKALYELLKRTAPPS